MIYWGCTLYIQTIRKYPANKSLLLIMWAGLGVVFSSPEYKQLQLELIFYFNLYSRLRGKGSRFSDTPCIQYNWWIKNTSKARVLNKTRISRRGKFALYERCAHSRWAPAVIPHPEKWYRTIAAKNIKLNNNLFEKYYQ